MKNILLIIFMFFACNNVYSLPMDTEYYDLDNLSLAETRILGYSRNDKNINPYDRLAKVEQKIFGTVQSGDFNSRVNFINKILDNSNIENSGYISNSYPKTNKLKKIVNDIFNGSITGYTPPVYNYPNVYRNYPLRRNYKNYPPQTPYIPGGGNFVTQSRVIILDD